jgi:hypothetical protein
MESKLSLIKNIAACPHLALCRSECNLITDPKPCVDYIGIRYRGLVIIGANPGIATTPDQKTNDERMFALQNALAAGNDQAFVDLMKFIPESMLGWRQLVNERDRSYLQYDIEEVAYVNLVKCSTNKLSSDVHSLFIGTAKSIPQRCWDTHTRDILQFLKPRVVIALWMPIRSSLTKLGFSFGDVEQFGAHNGSRTAKFEKRFEEIKPIFDSFKKS